MSNPDWVAWSGAVSELAIETAAKLNAGKYPKDDIEHKRKQLSTLREVWKFLRSQIDKNAPETTTMERMGKEDS